MDIYVITKTTITTDFWDAPVVDKEILESYVNYDDAKYAIEKLANESIEELKDECERNGWNTNVTKDVRNGGGTIIITTEYNGDTIEFNCEESFLNLVLELL